jgi:NTP pyrophosphatase (non-canonical NTP hydrolase)
MELYQWLEPDEAERLSTDPAGRKRVSEELADVLAYLLSLANRTGIDPGRALLEKIAQNRIKYPSEIVRGRWQVPGSSKGQGGG